MFKLAEPDKIGAYLAALIEESEYKNQRQFCIEWLKRENQSDEQPDSYSINKRSNKLTQIKKGKKNIQIQDFPIFCNMLHVSCEEILSAGKMVEPVTQRLTNYAVAVSNDKKFWEEYIHDAGKPILNADEWGYSVLDYAVKFKNIAFINYLIDNKYIWFDNGDDEAYSYAFTNFGAGTSIERRTLEDYDYYLQPQLQSIAFREKIIALAIEKNDLKLLKEMKAREIPDYYSNMFYQHGYKLIGDIYGRTELDKKERIDDYYNQDIINNFADANDTILEYFTDKFKIKDNITNFRDYEPRIYEFTYLFISELLEMLVKSKNSFAEKALKKAIEYNKKTYYEVKKQLNENIEEGLKNLIYVKPGDEFYESEKKKVMERYFDEYGFEYDSDTNFIRVTSYNYRKGYINVVRNMIRVDAESDNPEIMNLIAEINEIFDKIVNIKKEFI